MSNSKLSPNQACAVDLYSLKGKKGYQGCWETGLGDALLTHYSGHTGDHCRPFRLFTFVLTVAITSAALRVVSLMHDFRAL